MKSIGFTAILSALLLPSNSTGQSIPYGFVATIQESVESVAGQDGIVSYIKMTHSLDEDQRPFRVFLESAVGRNEITVKADGMFDLPPLPRTNWEQAKIVHSLEKGALSISFGFGFEGPSESEAERATSILEMCSKLVTGFKKLENIREQLNPFMPGLADVRFAIMGISFARVKPVAGEVMLQRQGSTVASIELTETGPTSWTFSTYDPSQHRIVWRMKNGEKAPGFDWLFGVPGTLEEQRSAIYLWKGEPGAPVNADKPRD